MLRRRRRPARRFAAQFPATRFTTELDDLLSDADAGGVVVATPVPTHHAVARRALEAGKHVFVEKPLAWTVAEARELDDAGAPSARPAC